MNPKNRYTDAEIQDFLQQLSGSSNFGINRSINEYFHVAYTRSTDFIEIQYGRPSLLCTSLFPFVSMLNIKGQNAVQKLVHYITEQKPSPIL